MLALSVLKLVGKHWEGGGGGVVTVGTPCCAVWSLQMPLWLPRSCCEPWVTLLHQPWQDGGHPRASLTCGRPRENGPSLASVSAGAAQCLRGGCAEVDASWRLCPPASPAFVSGGCSSEERPFSGWFTPGRAHWFFFNWSILKST